MIEFLDTTYSYRHATQAAVGPLNLVAHPGEITCMIGPTSAGKSTLVKLLAGVLPTYQGEIRVCGRSLMEKKREYYQQIGVLFETPGYFSRLTLEENLRYFQGFYSQSTLNPAHLLEKLGFKAASQTFGQHFSKAMQQGLGVARALLHDPEVLILDDPSLHLDPEQLEALQNLLLAEKGKGKTLFITTQHLELAQLLADQLVFIEQGKITHVGPAEAVWEQLCSPQVEVQLQTSQGLVVHRFSLLGLSQNRQFQQLLEDPQLVSIHSLGSNVNQIFNPLQSQPDT